MSVKVSPEEDRECVKNWGLPSQEKNSREEEEETKTIFVKTTTDIKKPKQVFEQFDTDGSKSLDRIETLQVDQTKQDKTEMASIKTITNIKKPRQVFEQFDTDKNGSLNRTETRAALSQLGCTMADEAFDKMFDEFDKSKDGAIDYKEFKTTL